MLCSKYYFGEYGNIWLIPTTDSLLLRRLWNIFHYCHRGILFFIAFKTTFHFCLLTFMHQMKCTCWMKHELYLMASGYPTQTESISITISMPWCHIISLWCYYMVNVTMHIVSCFVIFSGRSARLNEDHNKLIKNDAQNLFWSVIY